MVFKQITTARIHYSTANNASWFGRELSNGADMVHATGGAPKGTAIEGTEDTGAEPVTLQLAPAEVLALYSFLALGVHFAAIASGENSPLLPDEIRNYIATLGEIASNTLMEKLAGALATARERQCHREQLPKTSPEVADI